MVNRITREAIMARIDAIKGWIDVIEAVDFIKEEKQEWTDAELLSFLKEVKALATFCS